MVLSAIRLLVALSHGSESVNSNWVAHVLDTPIADRARTLSGVCGKRSVGTVDLKARIWNTVDSTGVGPDPDPGKKYRYLGVSEAHVVGEMLGMHACLWGDPTSEPIDLNPEGAMLSMAVAVSGDVQVGDATFDNNNHAYLWKGTAASAVDLHPASYISSRAMAVSGDTQVGFAQPSTSGSHAGLWKGTAASWVDLNPVGAVASFARGVQGMTQVGEVNFDKLTRHAGLWTGTAQSFLDLHPIGAFASGAMGVFGSYQVGFVRYGSTISAALWKGTVASLSNLGALLPENFISSNANFITADAEKMYIYGTAFDGVSKKRLPVVWTKAVE